MQRILGMLSLDFQLGCVYAYWQLTRNLLCCYSILFFQLVHAFWYKKTNIIYFYYNCIIAQTMRNMVRIWEIQLYLQLFFGPRVETDREFNLLVLVTFLYESNFHYISLQVKLVECLKSSGCHSPHKVRYFHSLIEFNVYCAISTHFS